MSGCINTTLSFSASGSPSGGTYAWSGGENPATGQGANFQTQFSSSGQKTVTVTYTCPDGATATANVNVKVLDGIEFQTDSGAPLSSPLRLGITVGSHDRKRHLRAAVCPASEVNNVTLSASSGVTISNVHISGNYITFDAVGNAASSTRGDQSITATDSSSGTTVAQAVSVVVPSKVGSPHDLTGGGLVSQNMDLDATTSPGWGGATPGNVLLSTIYVRFLVITVTDQFDDNIGDIYAGALVSEYGGTSINQNLTTSSTYSDPVGVAFNPANPIVPAGSARANSWPTSALLPMQNFSATQNIPVEVDGFPLNPAIVNRQVAATPPSTVTITWP